MYLPIGIPDDWGNFHDHALGYSDSATTAVETIDLFPIRAYPVMKIYKSHGIWYVPSDFKKKVMEI